MTNKKKKKARDRGGGHRQVSGHPGGERPPGPGQDQGHPVFSDVKGVKIQNEADFLNADDIADITLDDEQSGSSDDDILTTPPETASAPLPEQWLSGSGEYASVPGDTDPDKKRKYPALPSSDWSDRPGPALPARTTSRDPKDNDPESRNQAKSRDLEQETLRARAEIHRHNEALVDIDMDILLNEQISQNLQNEADHRLDERDVLASKQELLNARKDHRERIRHLSGEIDQQQFGPKLGSQALSNNEPAIVKLITKTLGAMKLLSEEIKDGKQRMSGLENIIATSQKIKTPAHSVSVSRDTRGMRAVTSKHRSHKTREQSADQGAGARQFRGHGGQRRGGSSPSSSSSSDSDSSASSSNSDSDSQDDGSHHSRDDRDTPHPRGGGGGGGAPGGQDPDDNRFTRGNGDRRRRRSQSPRDVMRAGQRRPVRRRRRSGGGSPPSSPPSSRSSSSSAVSRGQSIFAGGPGESLLFRLKMVLRMMKKHYKKYPNMVKVLDTTCRKGERMLSSFETEIGKLRRVPVHIQESLMDVTEDIEKWLLKLTIQIQHLNELNDEKKRGVKASLPEWRGDPLEYPGWKKDLINAVKNHPSESERMTSLRASIKGHESKDILDSFSLCENMKEIWGILDANFGNYLSQVAIQTNLIRDLPDLPGSIEVETRSVEKMLKFIRWLKSHHRNDDDFSEVSWIMSQKVNDKNQDKIYDKDLVTLRKFDKFLKKIQRRNRKKLAAKKRGQTKGVGHDGDGGVGGRGRGQGALPESGARMAAAETGGGGFTGSRCFVCTGGHRAASCPSLRPPVSRNNGDIRRKLKEGNICPRCIFPIDERHRTSGCSESYFDKKTNTKKPRACQLCDSGLNGLICLCKGATDRRAGGGGGRGHVQRPPPQAGGWRPQPPLPQPITGGGGQPGRPETGARSAQLAQPQTMIKMNGTVVGRSITKSQWLRLVDPRGGQPMDCLVVADDGCQNCCASFDLRPYSFGDRQASFTMKTLGKSEECNGGMGTFQLMSRHNQNMGFLVDCLYNNLSEVYLRSQYVDVPRLWQEKYGLDPVHCTPEGFGVIILGSDMQQFHPWPLARDGGLVLYKSQIDGQFVFGGSLSAENMHKYGDLPDINSVGVRRIAVECSLLSAEDRITSSDRDWEKIAQGEQGSLIPLLCSKCRQRSCSDCSKMFEKSPQVAYEDEILASSLSLERSDENGPGVWKVKCKYNQKLRDVPDLEDATKKFQLRLEEKKLTKNPELSEGFNKKIQEGIDRGDFVYFDELVSKYGEHIKKYKRIFGPVNFVKKSGATTATRPVFNHSFAPNQRLPSLNDARFRGSSGNKNIAHILIHARLWRHFALGDLQRFYQQCKLADVRDMLLNSFWFREGGYGGGGELRVVCSRVVNFGQRDAQALVSIAKHKTSELFILPHSRECYEQLLFALTDDTGLGADSREQLQELIDIATQGMAMGSFKYKGWVVGGDANSDLTVIGHKDHGTGSCLGLLWKISSDSWMIPCSFNLSPKSRGVRDPKFDINSLSDMSRFLDSFELSKRALLRYISSWYDPLHLFGQIRAYLTLIYRRAIKTIPGQHWESAVTPEIYADLLKVTKMMFELKDFEVKRFCFEGIIGKKIELIGVSDGSDLLAAGRIFVRYRTGENTHGCKYLFGNVLLIGTGDESSVRCECHAFFMTVTMLTLAKELIKNYTIENIYIVSDSQITLSGVCSLTARQKLYYRQRNGFSRSQIEKLEIQILYCPGEFSDGDIFTKIRKDNLNGALTESYWNSIFFEKSKKEWPTKEYKYDPAHVGTQILDPGLTVCVLKTGIYQDGNWILNRIVLRFPLFSSMIKCLAYLFLWRREETLHSAMEKARLTLLRSVKIGEDVVSGLRRSFRVVKNDGLWFVLPRAYMEEGNETQQKLILVDGHSYIGQSIIRMVHTHVAAVGREISKMYKLGIYVTKNRHLFKKMQDNCYTCRRVRRQNLETIMGASHVDQASRNVGSMVICHFDPVGPMKLDLGGGILGKLFILSICCIFSRYLRLIPLADMTASSIVKAVRIAAFQTGGVCPQILFCDSASNLKALMAFEEDKENIKEGEDLEKTVDNLKRVFHSNGISLRPAPAKSSWRSGGIESQQKLFKTALKRSNLYHQKLKMQDWLYTLARIENEINSRGICLSYMDETFTMVTPQNILFGSRKNDLPRDINLDNRNDDLFGAVKKVDQQIDQWMNIYHRTYALEIKKFFKWKQKKTLDKKDVCYILDRMTEAGTFTLGVVTDILSNRTYELQYIKKAARVDKKTYKITKTARKSKLIRPINQLTFICKESECTNVNIDIFSSDAMDQSRPDNENLDQQVTDEIMDEEEIFMEDPEVNKDVDHELDDMIVAAEPKEVTDEIIKEDDGVNQLEENGEVIVHDKQDIVTVEDEVVVEEPQEIRDMENQDTNVDKLDKEKSNKSIAVQFAGDEEIKDIVTNPRAQGGSAKGQGKRRKRKKMNW